MLQTLERQRVRPRSRALPSPSLLPEPAFRRPAPRRLPVPARPRRYLPAYRQSPVDRRAGRGRSLLGRRLEQRPAGRPRSVAAPAGPAAGRPAGAGRPAASPCLRLLKRIPLEAVLGVAIVAVTLAFLWSRQPLRGDQPLRLPADGAGTVLAYEARLAAAEPEPPLDAPDAPQPPNRLQPQVLESLKVVSYEVKPGDTISTIAGHFSLNLDTLLSYNEVRNVRRLTAGRVLQVPNSDGLKHRVSRGESLGGIAGRYGIALNSLLDWNSLESSVIRPGQELFIPGGRLPARELDRILGKLFIYPTQGRSARGSGSGRTRSPASGGSTTAWIWPTGRARRWWRPWRGGWPWWVTTPISASTSS